MASDEDIDSLDLSSIHSSSKSREFSSSSRSTKTNQPSYVIVQDQLRDVIMSQHLAAQELLRSNVSGYIYLNILLVFDCFIV